MRLNKYLADCGVASRRKCDEIIKDGRVKVNGKTIIAPGTEIDKRDIVLFDDTTVSFNATKMYFLLNKPKGCVTTVNDEKGRKTVMDLLSEEDKQGRLFPVGRLDYDTEGMLIITNDGDLAFRLTHPRNEIPKTYLVKFKSSITDEELLKLRSGIVIDGRKTAKTRVKIISVTKDLVSLEITITEGRNRQIRRMFEELGKSVTFLKRVAIGDMRLGSLNRGAYRKLTPEEVFYLENL